ncbi:50S ribosomal protein L25 [Candidatus Berkelbacteria bacterium]|nr:50S ribosomal protein L25 [Candidatus Berkelbacteria bacterium]
MTTEKINLSALLRTKKKAKAIRNSGMIPAVLYGHDVENTSLQLDSKKFEKIYDEAGGNTLIDLEVEGKKEPVRVLVQDIQFDPIVGNITHADLYAVNLKEKVVTEIPLKFTGESAAVVDLEGNLVTNLTEVEVKALPTDLISEIEVDISQLKTFDDVIRASDLKLPDTIELMEDPERAIALVTEPRSEEEMEALDEDTSAAEEAAVEELGKDKEQPEEGEEGGEEAADEDEEAKEK